MTYGMRIINRESQVASIDLAGALLRAWVRGDRLAFEAELDRSSRIPPDHQDTGEAERLQMLSAIAIRLKACDDPFLPDSVDLGVGVCVNLLSHLACPTTPIQADYPGYLEVQSVHRSERPGFFRSRPAHLGTSTVH